MSGDVKRPGGFALTRLLLEQADLTPPARVVDIGCGTGATVEHLTCLGFDACGIDPQAPEGHDRLHREEAMVLGARFPESSLGGVLCECTLSLLPGWKAHLSLFAGRLRPGGWLLLSDVYSRSEPARLPVSGMELLTKERLTDELARRGFRIAHFQDHSAQLTTYVAESLLREDGDSLQREYGADYPEMKRLKVGYYTLTAQKGR